MSIYRSYFSKNNTIIKDSEVNTARNPVFELVRGWERQWSGLQLYTRFLFDLDLDGLKKRYEDERILPQQVKSHKLHIKNCINPTPHHIGGRFSNDLVHRDYDFKLMLFKVPQAWSEGTGNDFQYGNLVNTRKINNTPSNWFTSMNPDIPWAIPGVYSLNGDVQIIDTQYFKLGNEDIVFDMSVEVANRMAGINNGSDLASVVSENFTFSGSQTFSTAHEIDQLLSVTVNGLTQVLNIDFYYDVRSITFINTLLATDEIQIQYLPDLATIDTNVHLFTIDAFYFEVSGIFLLSKVPTTVMSVELNGLTLVETVDWIRTGQSIELVNKDLDPEYRIVVKYFREADSNTVEHHGYGIAYMPIYETQSTDTLMGVSFYSRHTSTFFAPFLESQVDSRIDDGRGNFRLENKTRLYLYHRKGNLDAIPSSVDITDLSGNVIKSITDVKKQSKGLYYVDAELYAGEAAAMRRYNDVWKGLMRSGLFLTDYEQEFTLLPEEDHFSRRPASMGETNLRCSGLLMGQRVLKGELITLEFELQEMRVQKDQEPLQVEYRLWVEQGKTEINIFDWTPANTLNGKVWGEIDTEFLRHHDYMVSMRYRKGSQPWQTVAKSIRFRVIDTKDSGS